MSELPRPDQSSAERIPDSPPISVGHDIVPTQRDASSPAGLGEVVTFGEKPRAVPSVPQIVMTSEEPAVAEVKRTPYEVDPDAVRQMYVDKGFSGKAVDELGGTARKLIATNTVKIPGRNIISVPGLGRNEHLEPRYTGSPEENRAIDRAIADTSGMGNAREQTRLGASLIMRSTDIEVPSHLADTPIVVVGAGPAGLITARELVDMGFGNVSIFEKQAQNGIWAEDNVGISTASRNNPADIVYQRRDREHRIPAAPGNANVITTFLDRIADGGWSAKDLQVYSAEVTGIEPGDLQHTVYYKTSTGEAKSVSAPIVINAIGLGQPVPASRSGTMETSVSEEQAGIRWQERITKDMAEWLCGKTVTMIGLGNSTAEMLLQIQQLNRQGHAIDYRVLTHYPQEAVASPGKPYELDGKTYKVFRDSANLGRYEGDLEGPRNVYSEALWGNKIIADVVRWDRDGSNLVLQQRDGSIEMVPCDRLYTLTGYRIDPDTLESMGMTVTDRERGTIAADYDGEIQRQPGITGRERVYPGYYGIGAVLKSPSDQNAPVIPGILHRVPDLVSGVVIRASEHYLASKKQSPK